MDGKKISITPDGLMLLYPEATETPDASGFRADGSLAADGAPAPLTAEEFEEKYRGFVNNTVSPEEFVRLCDLALAQDAGPPPEPPEVPQPEELLTRLLAELPEPPTKADRPPEGVSEQEWRENWAFIAPQLWVQYWPEIWPQVWQAEQEYSAREIYILKYLALMKSGRYYEAMSIARLMESRFRDALKALEMRATINMRRDNVDAALGNMLSLLAYCKEHGLDGSEYEENQQELLKRKERTLYYEASRFWRFVSRNRQEAFQKLAGTPIIIRGRAMLRINKESRDRYLIFEQEGDARQWISCQLPASEWPFISRVRFPAEVEVHGFLLNASERLILLYPSRFIKVIGK